ncbi:hypothetical protein ABER99_20455 [Paenibacillus glucanolyticus]|jgi:hypothetical protein|uniref:Uncharacterized protein n=1 Tax=Paenibacillus glucanolyticus TaxID=59843 RepID=A0A163GHB6_9BACL|nr:hypothetical protein [Paenibacillus glucanolyticus]KZS44973.1 hypothetical protein AWU65_03055 [Paenibacillus glucanolyticus]OMF64814.1 hypothetical protein BK142_31455 [Paenibacillus glucanolyticus]
MSKKWFTPLHWLVSRIGEMDPIEVEQFLIRLAESADPQILKSVFEDELINDGYYDDVRSSEWEKTSEMQWVYRVTDTRFDVLDVVNHKLTEDGRGVYRIRLVEVELSSYTEEQIAKEIEVHGYTNEKHVRTIYGSDTNYIIAQCIAENIEPSSDGPEYTNLIMVADVLFHEKGIKTDWIESIAV